MIHLGAGALESATLTPLIHDLALLHSLGVRLVLVHATRSMIEQALTALDIEGRIHRGVRVTDPEVLGVVRDVTAAQRLQLESLLSMGLPSSPMRGARLRVISGNFVTARPLGVIDGVDFQFTGAVRRIDTAGIMGALEQQSIVLLSPLGFSPTGEVFNLSSDELATAAAISVGADKLIMLHEHQGLFDDAGALVQQCTVERAKALPVADEQQRLIRDTACRACEQGVARAHLLSYNDDGALIGELFTHDGAGTLISRNDFEQARPATADDIAGVLELVQPLEEAGFLVRRSRELLEYEIGRFKVLERDGRLVACAALYPFLEEKSAELACIAIDPAYQGAGRGEKLLAILTDEARNLGIEQLFVLTTQTSHWFVEQGFVPAEMEELPAARKQLYNLQRNSKVLIKPLI